MFIKNVSNWVFNKVLRLDINIVKYKPFKGSSYLLLLQFLSNKKAVINIKNKDNQCFKWCILRSLHKRDINPERINDLNLKISGINVFYKYRR